MNAFFALNESRIAGALQGEAQEFERMLPGPDGLRHHLAHYVPDIVDRAVLGILIHITDISPIKEVESELRRQAETACSARHGLQCRAGQDQDRQGARGGARQGSD